MAAPTDWFADGPEWVGLVEEKPSKARAARAGAALGGRNVASGAARWEGSGTRKLAPLRVGLGEDGRGPTTCSSRRSIAPLVIPQMRYRGLTQPLVCRQPITRCKLEGDASAQCRSLAGTPTRWRRGLTAQLARSARIPSSSPSSRSIPAKHSNMQLFALAGGGASSTSQIRVRFSAEDGSVCGAEPRVRLR